MEPLVFTIKGQFAHWRKWFTTTSPLTYSFPPRTAVIGLIGAILGVARDDIPNIFPMDSTRIAVCPIAPIVKDRLPQNWVQSPIRIIGKRIDIGKASEIFQANLEVIRRPSYRIIFWYEDQRLMRELAERLKHKRWYYSPYLGMLGFLADIEFERKENVEEKKARNVELHAVLPLSGSESWSIEPTGSYIREERVPLHVLSGRRFEYLPIAYIESTAGPLFVKSKKKDILYYHLRKRNENVIWMEICKI